MTAEDNRGRFTERCEELAQYMIETECTVRAAASHFCISKSTVHKDVTYVLRGVNPPLFNRVKEVLEKNKSERHIRGGEATKRKYFAAKEMKHHIAGNNMKKSAAEGTLSKSR